MSQTFPVAIYKVPEDHPGWYGAGTLAIGGTTSNWTVELRGADNSVIVSVSAEGAITSALKPFSQLSVAGNLTPMPGQVFINHGAGIEAYVNVNVGGDTGLLEGGAGGNGEVLFRNRLEAFGPTVPQIFADLVGTWTGTTSIACPPPTFQAQTNTVTITADGHVTLEGKTQLCGGELPHEVAWGGSDDFLIPELDDDDYAYVMHMDAQDALNVSDGVFQILFDEGMNPVKMRGFISSELYELKNLVKE